MNVVALGALSALVYGASDFVGGYASRDQPAVRVTFGVYLASGAAILPALLLGGAPWTAQAVEAGLAGGVFGCVGTWLFYAALAEGPVGFVAPVVAGLCAVVPCLWAVGAGEPMSVPIAAALIAVVAAGVLIGWERDEARRPSRRVLLMTATGGLAFAAYYIAMGASPRRSGAVPLVVDLVTGALVAGVVLLARRSSVAAPPPSSRDVALVLGAGVSQGVGDVLLIFGLHLPGLAVVTALSALYPIGTVALGVLVLRERLRLVQTLGLALAGAGIVVLAVAQP